MRTGPKETEPRGRDVISTSADTQVRVKRLHRWIALTALHEELLERIAHEIYKVYKENQVFDDTLLDLCRHMDELFEEGRRHEKALEQDLSQFARANKVTAFFSKQFVRHNIQAYKRSLGDRIQELGNRAMLLTESKTAFCDNKRVRGLCKRAHRYRNDADKVWEEMVEAHKHQKQGPREPQTPLEHLVVQTDRIARRLLTNKRIRALFVNAIGYDEQAQQKIANEYGAVTAGAEPSAAYQPNAAPSQEEDRSGWLDSGAD